MASKSLFRDFVEAHRKNTKNFNGFMAVLYTSITVVLSLLLVILLLISFVNPLWFRQSLIDFLLYDLPVWLRNRQESLFKNYKDKVNLFDTLNKTC